MLKVVQQLAKSAEIIAESAARLADAAAATATATAGIRPPHQLEKATMEANIRHFSNISTIIPTLARRTGPVAVEGLAKDDYMELRKRNVGEKAGEDAVDKDDHTYDRTSGMLWWKLGFNVDVHGPNKPFPGPVQQGLPGLEHSIQKEYFGDVECDILPDALVKSKTFSALYHAIYKAVDARHKL